MKNILLVILLVFGAHSLNAQDIFGNWVGIITEGGEQFKFELNLQTGDRKDPLILHCRYCKKLNGSIVDHREVEKIITFFGIVNKDESINLVDAKLVYKEQFEEKSRTRYQLEIEMKGGVPWLVGYWQDYNSKGRKIKQGKIYLKREKVVASKA